MSTNYPETFPDYKGNPQPIKWPKKKTLLARVEDVFLLSTGKRSFAVVYGLSVRRFQDDSDAAHHFGLSCLHQAQCNGLLES